jgi:hypothetical protein
MCERVERTSQIKPQACRAHVEKYFSADAMVEGYVRCFEKVLSS